MRRNALILGLVLAAGLLLPSVASAADGVNWVGSLDEALKEAKDRGCLIFIVEVIDGEAANQAQKEYYRESVFVKASKDYVCLYACPQMSHGTTKVKVDGKEVTRCRDAPTITCEDHMKTWNDIRKNWANLNTDSAGNMKIPFQFIVDADGKHIASVVNGTVEGGFDPIPGAAMAEVLKQIAAQFGKGLSTDEYEAMKEKLAEAKKAEKEGDRKEALKLCAEIVERNDRTSLAKRAKEIQARIAKDGEVAIDDALALAKEDPIAGLAALEKVADDYVGTTAAKHAKAEIAELEKLPAVKDALADIAAREQAEKKLAAAESLFAKKDYAKALKAFDAVAKDYEGTPAGKKAKARAGEIRADEEIMHEALEQEAKKVCKGWLSMGKSYAQNGMTDLARKQFQKILDEYPGTSFAEEAAKELEKLK